MTFGQLRLQIVKQAPGVDPDVLDQKINDRLVDGIGRHLNWKALESDGVLSTVAAFPGTPQPWLALTAYALNALATDSKGHFQRVSTAGTTGATTPAWNDAGGTTADGSVVWTDAGTALPTLTVTQGSTAVVLSIPGFAAGMTGRRMIVYGDNETYTFTYVDSTHGTLDRAFEGLSNTAATFNLFQNIYQLPANYGEPIRGRNERLPVAFEYWDRSMLDDAAPARGLILDEPVAWCEAARDASGNRYAEVFPAPMFAAGYPFRYKAIATALVNATDVIPSWVSIRGLTAGVLADLGVGTVMNEGIYQAELSQMRRLDSSARGPVRIEMDSYYTRHRIRRSMNSYRQHLP